MTNTPEQTRYIEALCQIETGIVHEGQLYLPFTDLVTMVRRLHHLMSLGNCRDFRQFLKPTTPTGEIL